jgi:hypothetical protein
LWPWPPNQRLVCYTWVLDRYQQRFGGEFTPPQLRRLARLGFLRPAKSSGAAAGGTTRSPTRNVSANC